jgi:hypothetical protein
MLLVLLDQNSDQVDKAADGIGQFFDHSLKSASPLVEHFARFPKRWDCPLNGVSGLTR